MKRRDFLGLVGATIMVGSTARAESQPKVTVAKSPTCGCCGNWVDHMRASGFEVTVENVSDDQLSRLKRRVGLRAGQTSCHTAMIDRYFVEGHVPAEDVKRLLVERPDALGLAVPGMPIGSPGMEMGGRRDPFDTLIIDSDGGSRVFANHR